MYSRDIFLCMVSARSYCRENKENKVASVLSTAGRSLDLDIVTTSRLWHSKLITPNGLKNFCMHQEEASLEIGTLVAQKITLPHQNFLALPESVDCDHCRNSSNFCIVGSSADPVHSRCSCNMEGRRVLYSSEDNSYDHGELLSVSQNSWPVRSFANQHARALCKLSNLRSFLMYAEHMPKWQGVQSRRLSCSV
jgi:hypothetical protein